MRHRAVGFVALAMFALGATSGFAADLPRAVTKAPAMVPAYNWTGFYAGGNIGYGWGSTTTDYLPLPTAAGFGSLAPTSRNTDFNGMLGGAQIGYNWQTGKFVAGVEADIQGSDLSGSTITSPIITFAGVPFGAGSNLTTSTSINWFGTVRGRLGFTPVDNVLLYATGGMIYGNVDYTANTNFLPVGTQQYPASFSKTKVGWTAGAGVEWGLPSNWSLKFEYLYFDLGDESIVANGLPGQAGGTCGGGPTVFCQVGYRWDTDGHMVRAGFNYRFSR